MEALRLCSELWAMLGMAPLASDFGALRPPDALICVSLTLGIAPDVSVAMEALPRRIIKARSPVPRRPAVWRGFRLDR